MPVGGSTALLDAVTAGGYDVAAQCVVTLPVVGAVDVTAALNAISYDEQDTSSFPNDLAETVGMLELGGTVVLAGDVVIAGVSVPVVVLFNPNDPASPIYLQQVKNAPMTVSLGADAAPLVDRPVYVTTTEVDLAAGTVALDFTDVPPGWDNLPAIDAVLLEPNWNSGLTSEFVLDRIARTVSGGAISSWPPTRPQCIFAAGLRASMWPEVGSLRTTAPQPTVVFAPGPFGGSGLSAIGAASGYTLPEWLTTAPLTGNTLYLEGMFTHFPGTLGSTEVIELTSTAGVNNAGIRVDTTGTHIFVNGATITTLAGAVSAGDHRVAAAITLPAVGGSTASATVWLDSLTNTATASGTVVDARVADGFDLVEVGFQPDGIVTAGVIVTTESAGVPDFTWTPRLVCDTSLNPLQAVPAIGTGSDAYTELQTAVEAEGGDLAFRAGVLTFRNRVTIASQTPSRTVKASSTLIGLQQSQTGAFIVFNDIEIDYTNYSAAAPGVVFQPAQVWSLGPGQTDTWTRTIPNGVTVGVVDQSITYQTTDLALASIGAASSCLRASLDPDGLREVSDTSAVFGSVKAVTPSQIAITLTNRTRHRIYFVSPANYTLTPVGTKSLWINGVAVTPDNPTTIHVQHVNTGDTASTYQVPSNQYRQDPDEAELFGEWLLRLLSTATVAYGSVDVVADPSICPGDRITLDVPVADGPPVALDVFVWGVRFSASFESGQESWDMTLDVRAVAAPGEYIVGQTALP